MISLKTYSINTSVRFYKSLKLFDYKFRQWLIKETNAS